MIDVCLWFQHYLIYSWIRKYFHPPFFIDIQSRLFEISSHNPETFFDWLLYHPIQKKSKVLHKKRLNDLIKYIKTKLSKTLYIQNTDFEVIVGFSQKNIFEIKTPLPLIFSAINFQSDKIHINRLYSDIF